MLLRDLLVLREGRPDIRNRGHPARVGRAGGQGLVRLDPARP